MFGRSGRANWAVPTIYEKWLSALPEREAQIELLYSAGPESPENCPASRAWARAQQGSQHNHLISPPARTRSLLSPRQEPSTPGAVSALLSNDAGHRIDAGLSTMLASSVPLPLDVASSTLPAAATGRQRRYGPPPQQDDGEATGRRRRRYGFSWRLFAEEVDLLAAA
jgi:hypothetical protein